MLTHANLILTWTLQHTYRHGYVMFVTCHNYITEYVLCYIIEYVLYSYFFVYNTLLSCLFSFLLYYISTIVVLL